MLDVKSEKQKDVLVVSLIGRLDGLTSKTFLENIVRLSMQVAHVWY